MKRLLAISWSLPPLLSARSVQVGRTLNALAKKGWKVTVFTVNPDSLSARTRLDFELANRYLQNLHIEYIPAPFSYKILLVLRALFPAIAPMPDDQITWVSRLTKTIQKKFKSGDFDVMVTFGHPWSDHLAGLTVYKACHYPWVAHFSDPWADNPYYKRLSDKQRNVMQVQEAEVVLAARSLVFTSKATVDLVMAKYGVAERAKAFVVPHGFDKRISPPFNNSVIKKKPYLHLVYTGNLYGLRTPGPLLKSLVLLKNESLQPSKVKVTFVGRIKEAERWQAFVSENQIAKEVEFLPQVTYRESLDFASRADVLLLIDAPNKRESVFLPSKLVDYLVFEKPILGLTPIKGTSADLLRSLGCFVVPPDDVFSIASVLKGLIDYWQKDKLKIGKNFKQIIKKYDINTTTEQLDHILGRVK